MKKSQFISITTLILFSILAMLYSYALSINSGFNLLSINSLGSEDIIFQINTILDSIDKIIGFEYEIEQENISLFFTLSSGMNPYQNLSIFSSFLNLYDAGTPMIITHNFTDLLNDLNHGRFESIITPTYNRIIFDYKKDRFTITNASKPLVYNFDIKCSVSSVAWNPTLNGGDLVINYVYPNGSFSTYVLNSSANYESNITCGNDSLKIKYKFDGLHDEIELDYKDFSYLPLNIMLGFDQIYGNLFKTISPYSLTIVTVKYRDFLLRRGLN